MKEQNATNDNNLTEVLSRSEEFLEKNKKPILIVLGIIVAVVVLFFAARRFYFQPREADASADMFVAENLFGQGNFELALNGNEEAAGFLDIIDDYSCTKAGNLARYYAGICYLQMGKYNDALKQLKKYKAHDVFTKVEVLMLMGDAEAEMENYDEAIRMYEKAAAKDENYMTAPTALFKAAILYMNAGKNEKAVETFEKIKREYPEATESSEVDKYLGFAETK